MMRSIVGVIAAGLLIGGWGATAGAQTSPNGRGDDSGPSPSPRRPYVYHGLQASTNTLGGSPMGPGPGASSGRPSVYYGTPLAPNFASTAGARTSLNEPGSPPTGPTPTLYPEEPYVGYGAHHYVPRVGPFAWKPTYSYRPGVSNYRSFSPGSFVILRQFPEELFPISNSVTFGTFQIPGTAVFGPLTPGGYGTFIDPAYQGYVMPQGTFARQYVR